MEQNVICMSKMVSYKETSAIAGAGETSKVIYSNPFYFDGATSIITLVNATGIIDSPTGVYQIQISDSFGNWYTISTVGTINSTTSKLASLETALYGKIYRYMFTLTSASGNAGWSNIDVTGIGKVS